MPHADMPYGRTSASVFASCLCRLLPHDQAVPTLRNYCCPVKVLRGGGWLKAIPNPTKAGLLVARGDLKLFTLALDRIKSVEPTIVPFKENPDFNSEHFFDDVIGVTKDIGNTPRPITFWANAEQSKYILTKPVHQSQQLISRNEEDGSCIFRIDVVINLEMYSVFMSYGPGIKILDPPNAMMYMRDKLKEALALYDETE